MKFVIITQYRENYSEDPSNPYWKCKGGETYVVTGITPVDMLDGDAVTALKNQIAELVEYSNPMSSEQIIDWELCDNHEVRWEEWETPTEIVKMDDKLYAISRGTFDYPVGDREDLVSKVMVYTMAPGGEREDFICHYQTADGTYYDWTGQTVIENVTHPLLTAA